MKSQLLILSFLLLSIFGKTQNIRVTQFTDSIKIDDIKPHLETLASDRYEGRESGEQGQKMAAKYISNHFQSIGLEPYNQTASSYIQSFSFKNSSTSFTGFQTFIQPFNRTVIRTSNYYYKEDFEVENQSVELVWLGTGFDYSEVDVKGKIVVVWLATPADSILKKYRLEDSKSDEMKSFNLRSQLAKVNGAKGIFMIHPTEEAFDLYESRNQMMSKMNPQIKKMGMN